VIVAINKVDIAPKGGANSTIATKQGIACVMHCLFYMFLWHNYVIHSALWRLMKELKHIPSAFLPAYEFLFSERIFHVP